MWTNPRRKGTSRQLAAIAAIRINSERLPSAIGLDEARKPDAPVVFDKANRKKAGNVDLHAVGWLLVGSIPGVLLSSGLTVKLPDRTLRAALAITLLASGAKLIDIPHGNAIALSVLGVGLLAIAIVGFSRLAALPAAEAEHL